MTTRRVCTITSGRTRKLCARECGAAVVEFALIAGVFFLLIISIVELGVMFWVNLTMQYAVREGARYAITGQSTLKPTQWESVIKTMQDNSMGQWDAVSPAIDVTLNPGASQTKPPYGADMFGKRGDLVVLQLNCTWPLFTPMMKAFFSGGNYKFSVAATMRNGGGP
jgi:Flp pilus assembly protein TadG